MIKTPQVMTSANVYYATGLADKRVGEILARAELIAEDGHKEHRLDAHTCKACFYSNRIGGAAICEQNCASCGEPQSYGSTNTDALCLDCAKLHELCKHCGGDIEMISRRKPRNARGELCNE